MIRSELGVATTKWTGYGDKQEEMGGNYLRAEEVAEAPAGGTE